MLEHFTQEQSPPPPTPPAQPGPIDVHLDLAGLAAPIWQTSIDLRPPIAAAPDP